MRPLDTSDAAARPARLPNIGYAVLRSRIVVPRRFASGNVTYGTGMSVTSGDPKGSAPSAGDTQAGGVMSVTWTPRPARCRTRSWTDRSRPPTPCSGVTARATTATRRRGLMRYAASGRSSPR